LKIKLDKNTTISLESSKDKEKILFSTKIRGQNGKIFLSTLELDRDQASQLISELVILRSALK
jgi:hypothetical protein